MRTAFGIGNERSVSAPVPDNVSNGRAEALIGNAIQAPLFTVLIWDDETESFA